MSDEGTFYDDTDNGDLLIIESNENVKLKALLKRCLNYIYAANIIPGRSKLISEIEEAIK